MEKIKLESEYKSFAGEHELASEDKALLTSAKSFLNRSYSPYSKFKVAAAARLDDGTVVLGANQENASFPMCICAEQAVLSNCGSNYPERKIIALAITAKAGDKVLDIPVPPCGACRQSLAEYHNRQGSPITLILQAETGPVYKIDDATILLPLLFNNDFLNA